MESSPRSPFGDSTALRLVAGPLDAIFLPSRGMLGASLRHCGEELLGRVDDLAAAAANARTAGIPLLHPWANRLAGPDYQVAGHRVHLDTASRLLHLDAHGLPMHGVNWALLDWQVVESTPDRIAARLDWTSNELLAVFPFPHRLEMTVTLQADRLTVEIVLVAGPDGPVPVSFGFHPYLRIPGLPRAQWQLTLPPLRRLVFDKHGIPSGAEQAVTSFDAPLGKTEFDEGYAVATERPAFTLQGAGRRIGIEFLAGYRYVQVFAPNGKDYLAIEPMTAPTNALNSGQGLRLVAPADRFKAAFAITVSPTAQSS